MQNYPGVVVKKHGFLSSVARGFFGLLGTVVVCGTGLAFYGLHIVDHKAAQLLAFGGGVIDKLPAWQQALPPVLADAVRDRRAPEYREHVSVDARLVERTDRSERGGMRVVFDVKNDGDETVTVLGLRVVLADADGVPIREFSTYAATPLAIDGDWRGPLLPGGGTRTMVERLYVEGAKSATVEVTELRVWNADATPTVAARADTDN
ncbi:MAG: hypothetical protein AB7Q17_06745 [Phycisphaerae bacterium]